MIYDFIVIGGGIAGCAISHFLTNKKILLLEKSFLTAGASGAAGAFLFPKVGFNTKYTQFVNYSLSESFHFYDSLNIETNKKGVHILPRDDKDKEKFKEYEKTFQLNYKNIDDGFFFEEGGVLEPVDVCKTLTKNIEIKIHKVENIEKIGDFWIIDNQFKTKNIILATGAEEIIDIPYIKIRPVWGERIEIKTDIQPKSHFHKNCSISLNSNGILKIGATHKRVKENREPDLENANMLIEKANEIMKIEKYEIHSMKSGLRAGSIDFFPIVGKIIDSEESLKLQPNIRHGAKPKQIVYKEGLYILNGGGGRGFSNYITSARLLADFILNGKKLPDYLDTKRLFIKWARKS